MLGGPKITLPTTITAHHFNYWRFSKWFHWRTQKQIYNDVSTQHQLNKIYAADYSEATVRWEEWAVGQSILAHGKLFIGLQIKEVSNFML